MGTIAERGSASVKISPMNSTTRSPTSRLARSAIRVIADDLGKSGAHLQSRNQATKKPKRRPSKVKKVSVLATLNFDSQNLDEEKSGQ